TYEYAIHLHRVPRSVCQVGRCISKSAGKCGVEGTAEQLGSSPLNDVHRVNPGRVFGRKSDHVTRLRLEPVELHRPLPARGVLIAAVAPWSSRSRTPYPETEWGR